MINFPIWYDECWRVAAARESEVYGKLWLIGPRAATVIFARERTKQDNSFAHQKFNDFQDTFQGLRCWSFVILSQASCRNRRNISLPGARKTSFTADA